MYGNYVSFSHNIDLPKSNLYSYNKMNHIMHSFVVVFSLKMPLLIILSLFGTKSMEWSPYKMAISPLSRNDQSNKSTHILYNRCSRIKIVITDSRGYNTQTRTHDTSLAVVMYALLLGGLHRTRRRQQHELTSCTCPVLLMCCVGVTSRQASPPTAHTLSLLCCHV